MDTKEELEIKIEQQIEKNKRIKDEIMEIQKKIDAFKKEISEAKETIDGMKEG